MCRNKTPSADLRSKGVENEKRKQNQPCNTSYRIPYFFDFKPYSKSNCKSCFIINWNFCYCRKHSIREKSKESEKLWDFASYKVNNPKVKEHQAKEVTNTRISKKIERRPALLIIALWLLYNVFGTEVFRVCRLVF